VWNQNIKFSTSLQIVTSTQQSQSPLSNQQNEPTQLNNRPQFLPKLFKVQLATDIPSRSKFVSIFSRSQLIFETEIDLSQYCQSSSVIQLLNLELLPKFSTDLQHEQNVPNPVRLDLTLCCTPVGDVVEEEEEEDLVLNNKNDPDNSVYTLDSCYSSERSFNAICAQALESESTLHSYRRGDNSFSLSSRYSSSRQAPVLHRTESCKEDPNLMDRCLDRNKLE